MLFKYVESVMNPKTSGNKHHPGRGVDPDIHTSLRASEQHPEPSAFHHGYRARGAGGHLGNGAAVLRERLEVRMCSPLPPPPMLRHLGLPHVP